jgi:hypothetical protein
MKKIEIFLKGNYICTTAQSKTCKEAKENFIKNPSYQGLKDGKIQSITLNKINANDIECHFKK